jgi:hypothetical protein
MAVGSGASTGFASGIVAYVAFQLLLFIYGWSVGAIVPLDASPELMARLGESVGWFVLLGRLVVDLLLGAYLLSTARNLFVALAVFVATTFGCFLIEQVITAAVQGSQFFAGLGSGNVAGAAGMLLWAIVPATIAQAIGAFGASFAGRFFKPA